MELVTVRNSQRVAKAKDLNNPTMGEWDIHTHNGTKSGFQIHYNGGATGGGICLENGDRWQVTEFRHPAFFEKHDELALRALCHERDPHLKAGIYMGYLECAAFHDLQKLPEHLHESYLSTFEEKLVNFLTICAGRKSYDEVKKSKKAYIFNLRLQCEIDMQSEIFNLWRKKEKELAKIRG